MKHLMIDGTVVAVLDEQTTEILRALASRGLGSNNGCTVSVHTPHDAEPLVDWPADPSITRRQGQQMHPTTVTLRIDFINPHKVVMTR